MFQNEIYVLFLTQIILKPDSLTVKNKQHGNVDQCHQLGRNTCN